MIIDDLTYANSINIVIQKSLGKIIDKGGYSWSMSF